jgi:hypothetical protein
MGDRHLSCGTACGHPIALSDSSPDPKFLLGVEHPAGVDDVRVDDIRKLHLDVFQIIFSNLLQWFSPEFP